MDQFITAHRTPSETLILDSDATDDRVHGKHEMRIFQVYYNHHFVLPLCVFCDDELLAAYLRPNAINASHYLSAILKVLVTKLQAASPEVKIVIQDDSGFCRWRLIDRCDSQDRLCVRAAQEHGA